MLLHILSAAGVAADLQHVARTDHKIRSEKGENSV